MLGMMKGHLPVLGRPLITRLLCIHVLHDRYSLYYYIASHAKVQHQGRRGAVQLQPQVLPLSAGLQQRLALQGILQLARGDVLDDLCGNKEVQVLAVFAFYNAIDGNVLAWRPYLYHQRQ